MRISEEVRSMYQQALERLSDGILILERNESLEDNSYVILYCNTALCRLYGVSRAELIGKGSDILVESGCVDHSFTQLVAKTKKPITFRQTSKENKNLVTTSVPIPDLQNHAAFIVDQVRSLEALEFYGPESAALAAASPADGQKSFKPAVSGLAEFKSPMMQDIYKLADNMATKNINILILGASGTGKTQLARRIHDNSARKNGPFITIDCSTIPRNLIESELFGYTKGAFSGASNQGKQGLVEAADGGTLFLDEIGELPLTLQSKLLQFVQEKTYIPVGSVRPRQVDARIIAATNKDIPTLIHQRKFREDLYYRLSAVSIPIPPLKNRPEDVRLLIRYFTNVFNRKYETGAAFSTDAEELLCRYTWPGNIREMEHLIEFLILSCQGDYIMPHMLPNNIAHEGETPLPNPTFLATDSPSSNRQAPAPQEMLDLSEEVSDYRQFIEDQERRLIQALYPSFGTSYKLSRRLSISQSTANRLIRKYIKDQRGTT